MPLMPRPMGGMPRPMGGMMRPGGPPGPGALGAQPGPGSSPAVAPGGGAGNIATATTAVVRAYDLLKSVVGAFPRFSKQEGAIMRAMNVLRPDFGTEKAAETSPAAARQMNALGTQPNPLAGTPSPGLASAPLTGRPRPPMGPPPFAGGAPPGGPQ